MSVLFLPIWCNLVQFRCYLVLFRCYFYLSGATWCNFGAIFTYPVQPGAISVLLGAISVLFLPIRCNLVRWKLTQSFGLMTSLTSYSFCCSLRDKFGVLVSLLLARPLLAGPLLARPLFSWTSFYL